MVASAWPSLVGMVVMKNCDELVSGPVLAMDSKPGVSCFISKFSSSNLFP